MGINENNANRLAFAMMEKSNLTYSEAVSQLDSLCLLLQAGEAIRKSIPLQAAILTAMNCGKRAFLGGVFILLPENIKMLVPWSHSCTLNSAINELGGKIANKEVNADFQLTFGLPCNILDNSAEVICNGWQGGINPTQSPINLTEDDSNLPLGGISAGSLAVGMAFMVASKLDISCADTSAGISLWRPDLYWLDSLAIGKQVLTLPQKIWILGLGHLGQGYLWNLGFLNFANSVKIKISLQDFDKVVEANYSAGLLCEQNNTNIKKARVCSEWLEKRGFETNIIERAYDSQTTISELTDDPYIALCGFDSASSRRLLTNAAFDLIIESGLGSTLSSFDNIVLHTFPNASKSPDDIWKDDVQEKLLNVQNQFDKINTTNCGVLAQILASKSISSSFVGAFTGSLVVAELIRSVMCETRYDKIIIPLRRLKNKKAFPMGTYSTEAARNGTMSLYP